MKLQRYLTVMLIVTALFSTSSQAFIDASWVNERPGPAAFDPGPSQDPDNVMARKLIDLHAEIPSFPGISDELMRGGKQKFRPAYGPIPFRMILEPNNVKILFIGQDGTHVAEAAGRPATAGFGGRAQDLAAFFGVEYSAAFINTYAFTIKGQYGARGAPIVYDGKVSTRNTVIPTDVWAMSQDLRSPLVKWRNDLIEWIIENNKESLKMIVLFGGSAKDSIATFVESRGGKVGSYYDGYMDRLQLPEFSLVGSGGNGEFAVPFNKNGDDLYASLLGESYINYKDTSNQRKATDYVTRNSEEAISNMVFTKAGPYENGLLHPAQIGGYDLDEIYVDKSDLSQATRSLKGLKLKSGESIKNDILVTALPHPTYLSSRMNEAAMEYWVKELQDHPTFKKLKSKYDSTPAYKKLDFFKKTLFPALPSELADSVEVDGYRYGKDKVAQLVEYDVQKLRPYQEERNWMIPADASDSNQRNTNSFAEGKQYEYGRTDIHSVYYDFGTPNNRMVSKSTARRGSHRDENGRSRGSQIIIFGSRDVPQYDDDKMNDMLSQKPNESLNPGEMFISKTRTPETRYVYDRGPGKEYAKLMKDLDYSAIFSKKSGQSFSKNGIDAYRVKSHPSIGDFGHYRGTFAGAKALIMADPDGYDDLITARALTGTRGQYLQGLMKDIGIEEDYLLLKTVPFGMDEATDSDWNYVLEKTKSYREKIVKKFLKENKVKIIIADGERAASELKRILTKKEETKLVVINRKGLATGYGITQAAPAIKSIWGFKTKNISGKASNIPRSHLSYYARAWEGTSGDRVLNSEGKKYKGLAFSEVVPNWVMKQDFDLSLKTAKDVKVIKSEMKGQGFPAPNEKIKNFCEKKDCSYSDESFDNVENF